MTLWKVIIHANPITGISEIAKSSLKPKIQVKTIADDKYDF